jgi:hypothetical protein
VYHETWAKQWVQKGVAYNWIASAVGTRKLIGSTEITVEKLLEKSHKSEESE